MANVLLVTDYAGNLHMVPTTNRPYYESRNKLIKDKQFVLRDMEESEAKAFVEKHKGIDPSFITAAGANKTLSEKNAQIEEKDNIISEKDAEIARLKALLDSQNSENKNVKKSGKDKDNAAPPPPPPPADKDSDGNTPPPPPPPGE